MNVLIIATCGLIYELLAGTLASYVLGDSVTQFSLVIGLYLSAMGVGAWLARFIGDAGLARAFIEIELGVALLGGISAPLLFFGFARLNFFHGLLYSVVFAIGVLVGLELPLLMRIVKDHLDFKELVSRVLAFDYLGALVASLLFPILFVPKLGLVRTSLLIGMLNAAVGLWGTWLLRPLLPEGVMGLRARGFFVLVLLGIGVTQANRLTIWSEEDFFQGTIIYAKTTPFQRIVVTRSQPGFQLWLNRHLQFASADEYRYHEALAHPPLVCAGEPKRVLILGGGDGLALREVLKHASVEEVTVVDLDPGMTSLAENFTPLGELNRHAYRDPRVRVVNRDAFLWVDEDSSLYDVAIIDFPDPTNFALGKLYSTRFFRLLRKRLTPEAAVSIQCSSPLLARKSFWCILKTMEAAGFHVRPYHVAMPSFRVWGFGLARLRPFDLPTLAPRNIELHYLNDEIMTAMFAFPADMQLKPEDQVEINRLDNQVLVRYHEAEWGTSGRWD
ncbi:MAG: polyamine aminopropyltransferase [Planctomycetia bacterium]|nr:polyamine aminopropyltransferase [Planctomycetia bacterium]